MPAPDNPLYLRLRSPQAPMRTPCRQSFEAPEGGIITGAAAVEGPEALPGRAFPRPASGRFAAPVTNGSDPEKKDALRRPLSA